MWRASISASVPGSISTILSWLFPPFPRRTSTRRQRSILARSRSEQQESDFGIIVFDPGGALFMLLGETESRKSCSRIQQFNLQFQCSKLFHLNQFRKRTSVLALMEFLDRVDTIFCFNHRSLKPPKTLTKCYRYGFKEDQQGIEGLAEGSSCFLQCWNIESHE
ncbi:hypothetical protein P8452_74888 [Trifolium repens]|nr:hypothetical protein P8452_74888 [Trifolium repens]